MENITPLDPRKKKVIQGYGDGGFTVSGVRMEGGIAILPDDVAAWPVTDIASLTPRDLGLVLDVDPGVEVLVVGAGTAMTFMPPAVNKALRAANIGFEVMDTGAACRTYNILIAEDRRVAALLIAV